MWIRRSTRLSKHRCFRAIRLILSDRVTLNVFSHLFLFLSKGPTSCLSSWDYFASHKQLLIVGWFGKCTGPQLPLNLSDEISALILRPKHNMNGLLFWFVTMATWVRRNSELQIAYSPSNSLYSSHRKGDHQLMGKPFIQVALLAGRGWEPSCILLKGVWFSTICMWDYSKVHTFVISMDYMWQQKLLLLIKRWDLLLTSLTA